MALTNSTMVPLGTTAPDFKLIDVRTGHEVTRDLAAHEARAFVVVFMCAHCPFVVHLEDPLAALLREYSARGVKGVAISSNNVDSHPDDSPEHLAAQAERIELPVPYLYDESQSIAQAYHAACTPDFFVFDGDLKLAYRGRFDASRPGNDATVDGADLRAALDAVLSGDAVSEPHQPSAGCNIKWKPGNEPA